MLQLGLLDIARGARSIELARHVEALGYSRFWLADDDAAILMPLVAAATARCRIGIAGGALRQQPPPRVAATFRLVGELFPGRIDMLLAGALPPPVPGLGAPELWSLGATSRTAVAAARRASGFAYALYRGRDGPDAIRRYRDEFRSGALASAPRAIVAVAGSCASADAAARTRERLYDVARRYGVDELLWVERAATDADRHRSVELLADAMDLGTTLIAPAATRAA